MNYYSAQPTSLKNSFVRSEFWRAHKICNNESYLAAAYKTMEDKLSINGYPEKIIAKNKQLSRKFPSKTQNSNQRIFYIEFPFISDDFEAKLNRILKRNNLPVRPVNANNTCLKTFLKKNVTAQQQLCKKKNCFINDSKLCFRCKTVYRLTFILCRQLKTITSR